jgi:predicted transcriptional regulator
MPFTVVVDAEGQVVYAKRGMVTEKELAKALAPLLRP